MHRQKRAINCLHIVQFQVCQYMNDCRNIKQLISLVLIKLTFVQLYFPPTSVDLKGLGNYKLPPPSCKKQKYITDKIFRLASQIKKIKK